MPQPDGPVIQLVAWRVVLAVLTFRRPSDLDEVVPALVDQAARSAHDVEVLVVDNDPDGSAREQVERLADGAAATVRYAHEPEPGIATARNRALAEATGLGARVLVFIDDDERPSTDWLDDLMTTWVQHASTAVVGAVISAYDAEPDPWILAGGFFDRRRMPTGTPVDVAATNNLLLDLDRLGDLRFDARFGLSGGSDTLFSRALVSRGDAMVWCDEAVVTDRVPVSRLTRRWVTQKAFRSGNSWSRTCLELATGPLDRLRQRLVLTGRGAIRAVGGTARRVVGTLTRSARHHAAGTRTAARGAGMALGAWGYVYSEYKR